MTILRWKGQSLQLHRNLTGPASPARRHGIYPRYVQLAGIIAAAAGHVAGLAKKAWRDDAPEKLDLAKVQSLRAEMNSAFDLLEAIIALPGYETISAIDGGDSDQAEATYADHGNFGLLALALMEESAELAEPLFGLAAGRINLKEAQAAIMGESADLRIYLHITSELARICSETSTRGKWDQIRTRFPEEAFQVPAPAAPAIPARKAKTKLKDKAA